MTCSPFQFNPRSFSQASAKGMLASIKPKKKGKGKKKEEKAEDGQ